MKSYKLGIWRLHTEAHAQNIWENFSNTVLRTSERKFFMSILIIYSHILIRRSESRFFQNLHLIPFRNSLSIFIYATFEFRKSFTVSQLTAAISKLLKEILSPWPILAQNTTIYWKTNSRCPGILFFNHLPQNMTLYSHNPLPPHWGQRSQ